MLIKVGASPGQRQSSSRFLDGPAERREPAGQQANREDSHLTKHLLVGGSRLQWPPGRRSKPERPCTKCKGINARKRAQLSECATGGRGTGMPLQWRKPSEDLSARTMPHSRRGAPLRRLRPRPRIGRRSTPLHGATPSTQRRVLLAIHRRRSSPLPGCTAMQALLLATGPHASCARALKIAPHGSGAAPARPHLPT